MFQDLTASDWVLLAGAIVGPILAVLATRVVDALRESRDRKSAVFYSLMSTRRAQLTPEHVQALNRIELEFANSARVITELKAYMNLMEERVPPLAKGESDEAVKRFHSDLDAALVTRRRRAFGNLVQVIGHKLGRRIDRYDIIEGGYYPGGWAEVEFLQLDNMRKLNDVLNWKGPFPIHLWRMSPPVPLEGRIRPGDQQAPEDSRPPGPNPGEPGSPFPPAPSP